MLVQVYHIPFYFSTHLHYLFKFNCIILAPFCFPSLTTTYDTPYFTIFLLSPFLPLKYTYPNLSFCLSLNNLSIVKVGNLSLYKKLKLPTINVYFFHTFVCNFKIFLLYFWQMIAVILFHFLLRKVKTITLFYLLVTFAMLHVRRYYLRSILLNKYLVFQNMD